MHFFPDINIKVGKREEFFQVFELFRKKTCAGRSFKKLMRRTLWNAKRSWRNPSEKINILLDGLTRAFCIFKSIGRAETGFFSFSLTFAIYFISYGWECSCPELGGKIVAIDRAWISRDRLQTTLGPRRITLAGEHSQDKNISYN